jgi:hypothetical protein
VQPISRLEAAPDNKMKNSGLPGSPFIGCRLGRVFFLGACFEMSSHIFFGESTPAKLAFSLENIVFHSASSDWKSNGITLNRLGEESKSIEKKQEFI